MSPSSTTARDRVDVRTAMKDAVARGLCPADCGDTRGGPHWHNYLDAIREAGYSFIPTTLQDALDDYRDRLSSVLDRER